MEEEIGFRHFSEATVSSCIQNIVATTCQKIKMRKMNRLLREKLPINYLSYIQNVSEVMHIHRQPVKEQKPHKTITEPEEMINCFRKSDFAWRQEEENKLKKKESQSTTKSLSKRRSICLSHKVSRRSQEKKTKRYLSKRRILPQVPKLIPLPVEEKENNEGNSRIDQLRNRKMKYQEALRQFKEEQEKQVHRLQRKRKEKMVFNFTTDFKGKIISFCPKVSKMKEVPLIAVKVDTIIDTNRPWGNVSFTATKQRKPLREYAVDILMKQE